MCKDRHLRRSVLDNRRPISFLLAHSFFLITFGAHLGFFFLWPDFCALSTRALIHVDVDGAFLEGHGSIERGQRRTLAVTAVERLTVRWVVGRRRRVGRAVRV